MWPLRDILIATRRCLLISWLQLPWSHIVNGSLPRWWCWVQYDCHCVWSLTLLLLHADSYGNKHQEGGAIFKSTSLNVIDDCWHLDPSFSPCIISYVSKRLSFAPFVLYFISNIQCVWLCIPLHDLPLFFNRVLALLRETQRKTQGNTQKAKTKIRSERSISTADTSWIIFMFAVDHLIFVISCFGQYWGSKATKWLWLIMIHICWFLSAVCFWSSHILPILRQGPATK